MNVGNINFEKDFDKMNVWRKINFIFVTWINVKNIV